MYLLGSHVGMSGKDMMLGSVREALSYGANTFMVYTGAPQNTRRKKVEELNIEAARACMRENGIDTFVVHAPYIINLANTVKPETFEIAVEFLGIELERTAAMGAEVLVLHPGAHVGAGEEAGIARIVEGLDLVMKPDMPVKIALETMAGKGSELGKTFEELRAIYDRVKYPENLRVCFDTCHVNDAGYDIVNDYEGVMKKFDEVIGLDQIAVFHINDSKNPLGAGKDRHENIGKGSIGFDTLLKVVSDERFRNVPKILETPYIKDEEDPKKSYPPYKEEIARLQSAVLTIPDLATTIEDKTKLNCSADRIERRKCVMAGKPYYLTTAIAYTSGKPHIGNTYEIVLADAIVRYKRNQGYDVRFQTGTDEHGQKIELKANEAGITPKEYVDGVSTEIKRLWDLMNTSYDKFIRTTDEDHEKQVQKIFKKLYEKGDIYKGNYEGMYCTPCESFFTPSQLVDGKCPDCGRECEPAKEEAYFLKLSKYQERLIDHIKTHPEFIQPESRKNEMMNNFLLPGLQDLCVSRTSFQWGVPVDFDPGHIVYVWVDALSNYITGLGYDADGGSGGLFEKFWPADLHLIGKDILRFHTIYWPIILMALDLPLPKQIFGHPWLLQNDGKMSKSKGNVLYADDLVEEFGVDAVRYFVLHEIPFDNDGVITWELVAERVNSDLANTLGNLVNRTISMSNKYFDGVVTDSGKSEPVDEDLKKIINETPKRVEEKMEQLRVSDAISEVFALFKRCNKYIDETMPWVLAKDEASKPRLAAVLYNLMDGIRVGAVLLDAFMPLTSEKILSQIGGEKGDLADLKAGDYQSGTKVVEKPEILFARIDVEEFMKKIREKQAADGEDGDALDGEAVAASPEGVIDIEKKAEITYDDFMKMQFQVGEIIACEEVKKSRKLLCSQVRIGSEVKQIVSGIKAHYSAEEMVGKKVMVLVNLKPAKLAGVVSEGMLLCAEDAEGNLALVVPEKAMPAGAEIC